MLQSAEVLTTGQLKRLTEHKYRSAGMSMFEPVMQTFWRWVVEHIPMTWAPNSITSVGLFLNVSTTLIMMAYSPDGKSEIPALALVMAALGLFIYQCLDAIDGKQARRTSNSTPLGELFDHGCDSVSTVFVMLGTCLSLQLGLAPGFMFFEVFASMFVFYSAHWMVYITGTLQFGLIDVTEGQFTVMAIHLLTAALGPGFWAIQVPVINIPMRIVVIFLTSPGLFLQIYRLYVLIFRQGGKGKNGSTVAGTSTIFPLMPIGIMILLALVIYLKSPSMLYEQHPCLYIISFGIVFSKVTNRLVVAQMTKSEMDLWDSVFIGPLLLFLNQYFNCYIPEYWVLWACCIYCMYDLTNYLWRLCLQICNYLNIYCFSITEKPNPKKNIQGPAASAGLRNGRQSKK